MRRPIGYSAFFSLLRSGSAGALALATILSCSDSMSPPKGLQDGVVSVEIVVPDALKQQLLANEPPVTYLSPSVPISATVLASPGSSASVALSSCGSGDASGAYTKSRVALAPEADPSIIPSPVYDDGILQHVPLGFSFGFKGNSYNEVNIYSNGFLMFGPAVQDPLRTGFFKGDLIPYTGNPNNIIAFAWTDWSPQRVAGGIRYETRGTAPNRRFLVQFTDVPEYSSSGLAKGRLTSQVVLTEGSNEITIYTTTMTITNSSQRVTQGIENAAGTEAQFDSVTNVVTGVISPRVKNFFNLSNDAIRFSPVNVRDEEKPSITAPDNITQNNDPGLGSAVVAVGSPVAADNCLDVTVSGLRSDGAAIDAPYPVGVTTITWTATDAAGNTASATQTVTVLDVEAPVFGLEALSSHTYDATSPSGAVVTYAVNATDNVAVTSLLCAPASGSVFPIGSTPVNCTASDAAGNTSSKSFSVTVLSGHEQLPSLIEIVTDLNLPNGTAQVLLNQLKTAYAEPGSGVSTCKKLADFILLVEKKGASIGDASEAEIIADAERIMDALGCGTSSTLSLQAY